MIVWDKNEDLLKQSRDEVNKFVREGCQFIQQCVDITDRDQVGCTISR